MANFQHIFQQLFACCYCLDFKRSKTEKKSTKKNEKMEIKIQKSTKIGVDNALIEMHIQAVCYLFIKNNINITNI